MGTLSDKMALPDIVSQADLYHRYNRSAPIRLVMMKATEGYWLKASTYGVGPLPDARLPNKSIRKGFERIAFEEEISALEQMNYEVHWVSHDSQPGVDFKQIRAASLPHHGIDSVLPKSSPHAPQVLMQKLRAGIRVTVVIDTVGKIAMYDPNQNNTLEKGVRPREKTVHFLKAGLSSNMPFSTILEGFYSDQFGLHVTDAIIVRGTDISSAPFSERIAKVSAVWEANSAVSTLSDNVIEPVQANRADLRSLAGRNVNNPVYLLRSSYSGSAILKSSPCLKTLVVDHEPAVDVAITTNKHQLNGIPISGDIDTTIRCKVPSKLFKFDMSRRLIAGIHTPSKAPIIF